MTDIGAVCVNISNYQDLSPDFGKGKISPILVINVTSGIPLYGKSECMIIIVKLEMHCTIKVPPTW
jgi:hypothetical protein